MFTFLRNHHTIFQSSCNTLHAYQKCRRVPVSLNSCQHLVVSDFLIFTILIVVNRQIIVALICTFIMTNDIKQLFLFLFVIDVCFLVKYILKHSAHLCETSFIFLLYSYN